MFIRLDRMYERARDTHTAWRHRPHLHSIARQWKTNYSVYQEMSQVWLAKAL